MKIFNLKTLAFLFITSLVLFTSCKKDKDNDLTPGANIVGEWEVSEGALDIYQDGVLLANVAVTTSGTITFEADKTGFSDFSITMANETTEGKGPFIWKEEGFELLITKPNAETERWARIDDEKNLQTIQFTIEDEDDPSVESEFILTLKRS